MSWETTAGRVLRFGGFEADLRAAELRKQGIKVPLQEQPFRILAILLEHAGEVVTREQLLQELRSGSTFGDFDHALNTAINKIRECLRDSATHPRFIETVPKRGYRFRAPVDQVADLIPPTPLPRGEEPPQPSERAHNPIRFSRRMVFVGLVAALLVLIALFRIGRSGLESRMARADPASIVVLPFVYLGPGPDEYFSDGLTDELTNALSRVEGLRVIGRTSAYLFKRTSEDVRTIGNRLGVATVLEGSVRKSGDRVRIAAQLVSALDGYQLWSETYDRTVGDIFDVQAQIARAICARMRVQTSSTPARLSQAHSRNDAALKAYLEARYLAHQRTAPALARSIVLFRSAIERDPGYALAYSGLANSYSMQIAYRIVQTRDVAPALKEAALKAIAADDTLAEAHSLLGSVRMFFDWDWPGAQRGHLRAIKLEPRLAMARQRYALHLMCMGHFDAALREIRVAQELDPLSALFHANEADILYHARRYERATDHLLRITDKLPSIFQTHQMLGIGYVTRGMYPQAIAQLTQARSSGGDNPITAGSLGYAHAVSGNRGAALAILRELEQREPQSWYDTARVHVALGNYDAAFRMLEKCFENRCREMIFLRVAPVLDPLRSDRRFAALLARVPLGT